MQKGCVGDMARNRGGRGANIVDHDERCGGYHASILEEQFGGSVDDRRGVEAIFAV